MGCGCGCALSGVDAHELEADDAPVPCGGGEGPLPPAEEEGGAGWNDGHWREGLEIGVVGCGWWVERMESRWSIHGD